MDIPQVFLMGPKICWKHEANISLSGFHFCLVKLQEYTNCKIDMDTDKQGPEDLLQGGPGLISYSSSDILKSGAGEEKRIVKLPAPQVVVIVAPFCSQATLE